MGVSASCYHGHMNCSSSAHARTPTFTAVYQLSGWIKAWFILFDYPGYSVIRHGSGTKVFG